MKKIRKNMLIWEKRIDDSSTCLENFTKRKENLEKLFGNQRLASDRNEIGYESSKRINGFRNYFVIATLYSTPHIVCNYCWQNGHIAYNYHDKKYVKNRM